MAYSPYQIAGTQASLYDLMQQSQLTKSKGQQETFKQKGKMKEEFEEELARAQAKARRDAKPGFLSQALSLAGMGLGPLGAGLASGISAGIQGDKQRQALKGLLSNVDSKRWGKTFLRDPMKSYKDEAQSMQMSSGDVLRGAIGSGLTSFATSKALGGDKETGGLFQKMFSKGPAGTAGTAGTAVSSPSVASDIFSGTSGGQMPLFDPETFTAGEIPFGGSELLATKMTPMKTLWEQLQGFGTGEGGLDEEFQQSMMMPQLIQMLMGQIGGR